MKKYVSLVLCLVLTASLFVGCGCTNRKMDDPTTPTVLPTNEEVWDTTAPATRPTAAPESRPTTEPTRATTTPSDAATDHGNGPLEDTTIQPTDTTTESRSRSVAPRNGR